MQEEQLRDAVKQYGTPLYLFDADILRREVRRIREGIGGERGLCFAMKANPFLTNIFAQVTDRIEICSMGEYRICKSLGIPSGKMLISGVLKKRQDIEEILAETDETCHYTAESIGQYRIFVEWSKTHRRKILLYLRLSSGNQFGMDAQTIWQIIRGREEYPLVDIVGIHYFSGTQKRRLSVHQKELALVDEFLQKTQEETGYVIRELEYGPGLAIHYFDDGKDVVGTEEYLRGFCDILGGMQWQGRVTLEMGRYLSARCGYYLTTIEELKQTEDRSYCIVDGGIHQMNYDGQIKGMYLPYVTSLPRREGAEEKEWTVCGSLCTINDVLCQKLPLKDARVGDTLVFERTGAYSVTEGMSLFLSHELPQVVLYEKEAGWKVLRKEQETYPWNFENKEEM